MEFFLDDNWTTGVGRIEGGWDTSFGPPPVSVSPIETASSRAPKLSASLPTLNQVQGVLQVLALVDQLFGPKQQPVYFRPSVPALTPLPVNPALRILEVLK